MQGNSRHTPEMQLLLLKVEARFGGMPETPRDFQQLSASILEKTKDICSSSTLRRIWGYDDYDGNTRRSTIDVLAKYAGYPDFRQFCKAFAEEAVGSGFIGEDVIYPESVREGERLELCWAPERKVVLRCIGMRKFVVEQSEGSKLKAGDSFSIGVMAKGYPVFLTAFFRDGVNQPAYVVASSEGLTSVRKL